MNDDESRPGSSSAPPRRWILLHGTPLGPATWADTRAALGSEPVVTPDCTAVPAGPDLQRVLAERLAASVSGELDVVGHSFGGQIALELALAAPDRVRSLTILCSRDTPFPPFAAAGAAIAGIAVYDRTARAGELTMPVTLIAAGQDGVSTPTAMADMARRIPGAVISVQDAWHHMSPFVTPLVLAEMLIAARDREREQAPSW